MRWRVVCALGVTMDSACPSIAFISVLLPALGRPMMVTKPACAVDEAACGASSEWHGACVAAGWDVRAGAGCRLLACTHASACLPCSARPH